MADFDPVDRPNVSHCLCTEAGTITSIDRSNNRCNVTLDSGETIEGVSFHFHCPGKTEVPTAHTAFIDGDDVILSVMRSPDGGTIYDRKVIGFQGVPRLCGTPGCHLSGAIILGERGTVHAGFFDCSTEHSVFEGLWNSPTRFEDFAPDFSKVFLAPGEIHYVLGITTLATDAIIAPPFSIPDLTFALYPELYDVLGPLNNSLDGIALMAGVRLEIYGSPNYENLINTYDGPGVWNTTCYNFGGKFNEWGSEMDGKCAYCEEQHWPANVQAVFGDPQELPWGTGKYRPPQIRSLKVIEI